MKTKLLLIIALLCAGMMTICADEDDVPDAVKLALRDANNYHPTKIKLDDEQLDWGWTLERYDNLSVGCKTILSPTMPSGLMMYDIHFTMPDTAYHYRVSADETFLIRCHELYPTQPDVSPYVTDALHEMNALLDSSYTLRDVTWTWQERWFTFDELGCGLFKDGVTSHVKGYQVFLTLGEHTYEYRMSDDRMVLSVCTIQGASIDLDLYLVDERTSHHIGEDIPIGATLTNHGSQDTDAPILLTITIPDGLYPTEVTAEGQTMNVLPMAEHVRDDAEIAGMGADTTRVVADGSLFMIAEKNGDIGMSYTFRLESLPANATRSFVFLFTLQSDMTGHYTISGHAEIMDDGAIPAVDSKVAA